MAPIETIQCPSCSATYRLTKAMAARSGKKARCALCGNLFIIPEDNLPGPITDNPGERPAADDAAETRNAENPPETSGDDIQPAPSPVDEPEETPADKSHSTPLVDNDLGLYSLDEIESSRAKQTHSIDLDAEAPTDSTEVNPVAIEPEAETSHVMPDQLHEALESLGEIVDELDDLSPATGTTSDASGKIANYGVSMSPLKPDSSHTPEATDRDEHESNLPDIEDQAVPEPKPRAGAGWWLSAIFLLITLAAQLGWHMREQPEVYQLVSMASEQLGYETPVLRLPGQYELTNRLFTRIDNSANLFQLQLQITNQASWPQPHPDIELTLTDKHGITRVRQKIAPDTYLKSHSDALIPAGETADISFIAESSSDEVVGFSLEFL